MNEEVQIGGKGEIEQALKEFEMKSSPGPTPTSRKDFPNPQTPKMIQLVIKWSGGSFNETQAQYILLGVVLVMIGVSIYLFSSGGGEGFTDEAHRVYQEDLTPELRQTIPENILKDIPYRNGK